MSQRHEWREAGRPFMDWDLESEPGPDGLPDGALFQGYRCAQCGAEAQTRCDEESDERGHVNYWSPVPDSSGCDEGRRAAWAVMSQ